MKKYLLSVIFPICISANACIVGPWVSQDKTMHAVGNFSLVFGTDWAVKYFDPELFDKVHDIGIGPGIIASSVREIYKVYHRSEGMDCEYASMTYDIAGMFIGYEATEHFLVLPYKNGVQFQYQKTFK